MHAFNVMYLVNEVTYTKTDFAILFSTDRAFFHSKDFRFGLFFPIDPPVYYGQVGFLKYHFGKPVMGNIWDNKRYLNKILYCTHTYNE